MFITEELPQKNGLAERVIQSVKKTSQKMINHPGTFKDKLQRFFTSYRNTPYKSTGKTTVEVLLGRKNRGKFYLFQPTQEGEDQSWVQGSRKGDGKRYPPKENQMAGRSS